MMDEVQNSRFTKFRTMTREVSRRWRACGAFPLLVLMAGCDPCMNNPCDNGLACDGSEICTADGGQAVCTDGTPVSCDFPTFCTEPDGACVDPCEGADCSDDNDCTTDICTTNQDGTTTCNSDTACDDEDLCTEGDTCGDDGVCAGTAIECAVGEVCADGVCVCADDRACDDDDVCTGVETCDVETGDCVAGMPFVCDDGEFCNGEETCETDAETGEPTCVAGTDPCDPDEVCDEVLDECFTSCTDDAGCDDGDACNGDETCDTATQRCVAGTVLDCDDGNACNGEESCDSATGTCLEGTPLDCDDADLCTEDTCDESAGCSFTAKECDEGESCNPATGECGDATPMQVDVLQFGDFSYPTGLFFCRAPEDDQGASDPCPTGNGCDEFHWHSGMVAAIASATGVANVSENMIDDPNPCFCGHGKISEVTRTMIEINGFGLADYLLDFGLDELPAADDCSP